MLKKFEDLRFAIGVFFLVLGVLLLGQGIFSSSASIVDGININVITGAGFIVFSLLALWLSGRELK